MTQEQYKSVNGLDELKDYKPRHSIKKYTVWRVLGPAGPSETIVVEGLKNVHEAILGCWDYDVMDEDGNYIPNKIIAYWR